MDKYLSSKEANRGLNLEKCVPEASPGELAMGDTLSINSAVVRSLFKIDENKGNGNKCYNFIKQKKILIWIERVFLIAVCTAVVGGFTVPIIIYAVNTDRGQSSSDLDLDSCSNVTIQVCKC